MTSAVTNDQLITELKNVYAAMEQRFQGIAATQHVKEPKVADPEYFNGDRRKGKNFVAQLQNFFHLQHQRYPTDNIRIRYAISRLQDSAFNWALSILKDLDTDEGKEFWTYQTFEEQFKAIFTDTDSERNATQALLNLTQGRQSASRYVTEFSRLISEVAWNEDAAIIALFYKGLNDDLKDRLAHEAEPPTEINKYYSLVVRLDNRLYERRTSRKIQNTRTPATFKTATHPKESHDDSLDLDAATRTHRESKRQTKCYLCEEVGHIIRNCPNRAKILALAQVIKEQSSKENFREAQD